MRMAEDKIVNFSGIEAQIAVHGIGFQPFSLEHSAIKQNLYPFVCYDEMLTAGHLAGSSQKFYNHCVRFVLFIDPDFTTPNIVNILKNVDNYFRLIFFSPRKHRLYLPLQIIQMNTNPMNDLKVVLKKKNIPVLVDFCLEESVEFTVKPQAFPDTDWEFVMKISDIQTAVVAGMFLRENRIEISGMDQQKYKKPVKKGKEEETTEKQAHTRLLVDKEGKNDNSTIF